MGTKSSKGKNDELNELAKDLNPIMSTSNRRACTIENGKIILNFNHFNEEYNTLNKNLEKLKNKMDIIISDDNLIIIQKKLEELFKITINTDIQNSINSFSNIYKTNLQQYYQHITEIKKIYKQSYLSVSTFLTNWLKKQTNLEINEINGEKQKIEEFENEMKELINKFAKFKEIEDFANTICYFKINYNSQDKFNEINQYFNENKDEIGKSYKIENAAQLRNIINIRDFLIDNISQKNNFSEMLVNFHKDYLSLYIKVIDQINSDKLEKVEMGNEFNEFNGVIIYHRLIRSIEERIKKIDLDK
jgi:hypothetical protein